MAILEGEGAYDLMVVDLIMPELSGLDTRRLAQHTRPDLKVLFISGYADVSQLEEHLRNDVLLKKPFKLETLAGEV